MTRRTSDKKAGLFANRSALIWIIVLSSCIARIAVILLSRDTFLWNGIWSDAATYDQWARRIVASGDWVGTEPFFMSPFYSYFLATLYTAFGDSYVVVRIVQALAGTATAVLIYLVGERYFSRQAAFVSSILAAFYGPFLLSSVLLLVETVKVFFVVLSLWLLVTAEKKEEAFWWFLPGLSVGLAALCRPTDLLLTLTAVAWIFSVLQKDKLRRGGLLLAGVLLVIVPVTARNYFVSGEFILISSNGGLNLYLGNNPEAVGIYYNVDRIDLATDPDGRRFLESRTGRDLTHSETSSLWMDKAMAFVFQDPVSMAILLARKFLLFFHHKEISQVGYNYVFVRERAIPLLGFLPSFLLVCPLGVLGCVWGWRRRKHLFLLYGFLAMEILSIVLFFMTDRFRLSAVPLLLLFAGAAAWELLGRIRIGNWGGLKFPVAILAFVCLGMTIANIEIPDEFSMEWEQIGLMHLSSRNPAAALQAFQESGKYKDSYHLRNNIGNAYAAMGQIDAALEQFRTGERMNAAQPVSPFSIGTAHASRQEWQPALNAFDRAISINPRFAPAHLNKGLVLFHMQQFEAALNELRIYTTLETDPSKLGSVIGDIRNLERLVEQQRAAKSQVTPQGKR